MSKNEDNLTSSLDKRIDALQRTMYTAVPARLEQVNDRDRGVVALLGDRDITADDVPVVSGPAGDGWGERHPLDPPVLGLLVCSNYPLDTTYRTSDHSNDVESHRHHAFQDGWFIPGVWANDQEMPDAAPGEYLYKHPSGATQRITEDGDFEFSAPDDGTVGLDGITSLGDSDAVRVDRTEANSDPEDPRQYAETNESVAPIVDPLNDGETAFDNSSSVSVDGPLDAGFFEVRRHVPERREADPDVTVEDPTDPKYVQAPEWMRDMGRLPAGYQWLNLAEDTMKRIAKDGSVTPME